MTNLKLMLTVCCALYATRCSAAVEMTKNHIMDSNSHHVNYAPAPAPTNLNLARTVPVYAQNRDSYANAAAQAGYGSSVGSSVGTSGGSSSSSHGVVGGSSNIAAAGSSLSSSYGVPVTGGSSGGYGGAAASSHPNPMTYYYYHYPGQQGAATSGGQGGGWGAETTGWGSDDEEGGFGGAGAAGGLGGLAGLLGLKGLKGLGGLGLLALLKLAKPLLLPLLLPFLLLLPALLLFLPVPVITIPSNGRALEGLNIGESIYEKLSSGVQVAQQVFTSSQCIERMACEISRKSQGTYVDSIVNGIYEKTETYLSKKWRRGMRAYIDSSFLPESTNKCAKFSCDMYKDLTSRIVPTTSTSKPSNNNNETSKTSN